jgi:Leucine-rich repeat (LRR) protein
LRNNQLRELPLPLCGLARLAYLDLRGNPLTELPAWILEWPNLQKLDLRWVKLASVPPAVGALEDRGCRVLL